MGILDNIVNSAENEVQSSASGKINSAISKKFNPGPASNVPKCPNCKATLPSPMPKFCPKCGTKLSVTCPKCKNDFPLGTKFCPDDGSKLS